MKFHRLFLTLFLCIGCGFTQEKVMAAHHHLVNKARLLLSQLRGGDYAHAGDEEAIEIVLHKLFSLAPEITQEPALDVGSGFGGTANYLYQKGFKNIQGVDIDSNAVAYGKEKYPHIKFHVADALSLDHVYPSFLFSSIYLFNVAYAIENKDLLAKKLAAVAKPGALLVICDYAQGKSAFGNHIKDLAGKSMSPLSLKNFIPQLEAAGWEVLEITDMTPQYIAWYKILLEKLSQNSPLLIKTFSEADILKTKKTFTFLLTQLQNGKLEATTIYGRKK